MEAACLTLRESLRRSPHKETQAVQACEQRKDDGPATEEAHPGHDQATQTAWPKKIMISRATQAAVAANTAPATRKDAEVQTREFVNYRDCLVNSEILDEAIPNVAELIRRKVEAREEQLRREQEERERRQEEERNRKREAALARCERQHQRWQDGK
ncbi:troponin I-like [Schistocerca cancellata]|uniref:troponin I-like n=1 Tax=Schistocerca cancellata TaxID=274614 RepID=UPI0021182ED2|nr:troponin I-like [Schistocerca cancellata]